MSLTIMDGGSRNSDVLVFVAIMAPLKHYVTAVTRPTHSKRIWIRRIVGRGHPHFKPKQMGGGHFSDTDSLADRTKAAVVSEGRQARGPRSRFNSASD
jgi:hypothetical protein